MARYQPTSNHIFDIPTGEAIEFNVQAMDDMIRSQGVMLEHWRAMRCPVGVVDKHDTLRRPHEHHINCSNGMIYTKAGTFQGTFQGNGLNAKADTTGILDSSTAQIIIPRFYIDPEGERIYPAPYDRFFYADSNVLVDMWEVVEASADGNDRLSFPVVKIHELMDNRGVRYSESDYSIRAGNVVWRGQNQPGQDLESGKGRVYSLRYLYRPFWYVSRMMHEIRVTSVTNPQTGDRVTEMVQKLVQVQREYIFLNTDNDPDSAADARKQFAPADGSYGAK